MHVFFFSESDELIRHEHDEDIKFDGRGKKYETSAMNLYEGSVTADTSKVYGGYLLMVTDSMNRIIATNDKEKIKLINFWRIGSQK